MKIRTFFLGILKSFFFSNQIFSNQFGANLQKISNTNESTWFWPPEKKIEILPKPLFYSKGKWWKKIGFFSLPYYQSTVWAFGIQKMASYC